MNIAIIGGLWGDEAKGSFAHYFSPDFDWVIRYAGGNNCGHTIYSNSKKYVHHLVPSIDFSRSNAKAFLASGMVINLEDLLTELIALEQNFPKISERVYVDPDAFVVLPKHIEEDRAKNLHIGTTNKGIGPAYVDKMSRKGVQINAFLNDNSEITTSLKKLGVKFRHVLELEESFQRSQLLFEGSQGVLLDINHGIYPFVSCGDATVSGIFASGFARNKLDRVYGVSKCYVTKVGEGPFPTEIHGKDAEELRVCGDEFGSTTNRPRRVGWLDLPALNYSCKKGGITHLIMTKFDILTGMTEIPVCVAYEKSPVCSFDFFQAKPQYEMIKGWKEPNISDLDFRKYIRMVEENTNLRVNYFSCGTNRKDIHQI